MYYQTTDKDMKVVKNQHYLKQFLYEIIVWGCLVTRVTFWVSHAHVKYEWEHLTLQI